LAVHNHNFISSSVSCAQNQVHVSASECLLEILKLSVAVPSVTAINEEFKVELLHQYEIEKNEGAKSILKMCVNILQDWKR
jgi:proteasome component ECM29